MNMLDGLTQTESDRLPWPTHGRSYDCIFEVEYIGPHWEDIPRITVTHAPDEVNGVLYDHSLRDVCEGFSDMNAGGHLPIASGIYRARLEFWFFDGHDPEGSYDCEYGFHVKALERLDNLPMEKVQ